LSELDQELTLTNPTDPKKHLVQAPEALDCAEHNRIKCIKNISVRCIRINLGQF